MARAMIFDFAMPEIDFLISITYTIFDVCLAAVSQARQIKTVEAQAAASAASPK